MYPDPSPDPNPKRNPSPHQARVYLFSMYRLSSGSAAPTTSLVTARRT
jgi:hypothetical protein